MRYESWAVGYLSFASRTALRNARTCSSASGLPTHWFAFLLKICTVPQPSATAEATAFSSPPATDRCAPSSGIPTSVCREQERGYCAMLHRGNQRQPVEGFHT